MKVIGVGKRFEIYEDELKTYERLPANTYTIRFNKMTGFYLELHQEIEIKEEKVYGVHIEKIAKVIGAFEKFNRNLGVILSGHKGIGKSLFAKMLGVEVVKKDIPLIIVDKYIPGIAAYIDSIEQEVMILFDEFDKTFGGVQQSENEADPQASLLSLFDGTSQGKKLFVVTCNKIHDLNDYLINRPGRFHYHFRFDYPSPAEVEEYLKDKLEKQFYDEIDNVVSFSRRVNLNYDCLRAIAFELNTGAKFADAIKDLNIINMRPAKYDIRLHFTDGLVLRANNVEIDFFDKDRTYRHWLSGDKYNWVVELEFKAEDCEYDEMNDVFVIPNGNFSLSYDEEDEKEKSAELKARNPEFVSIMRQKDKRYHYTV